MRNKWDGLGPNDLLLQVQLKVRQDISTNCWFHVIYVLSAKILLVPPKSEIIMVLSIYSLENSILLSHFRRAGYREKFNTAIAISEKFCYDIASKVISHIGGTTTNIFVDWMCRWKIYLLCIQY